jgi:hypothetical protein
MSARNAEQQLEIDALKAESSQLKAQMLEQAEALRRLEQKMADGAGRYEQLASTEVRKVPECCAQPASAQAGLSPLCMTS